MTGQQDAITLLDGGLGQEVYRRSTLPAHPLWSVKVMMDDPSTVVAVHRDYLDAGANCICINSYAATPRRLEMSGHAAWFDDAQRLALELAHRALDETGSSAQIAGCLPPLVSSYRGDVAPPYEESLSEYRRIVRAQDDGVSVFLIETMSSIEEARAAIDAAGEAGKPVYVGFTIMDDGSKTLRTGEPLTAAIDMAAARNVDGVMLNCSIPEAITDAMSLVGQSGLRFGGYANGFTAIVGMGPGTTVESLEARRDLGPELYANHVFEWIDQGATIVGGCCEVGPVHIRHLDRRLKDAGLCRTHLGRRGDT